MKFNKAKEGHAAMLGAYISDNGLYKCVKYDKWKAYFKPAGWPNFGNGCEKKRWHDQGQTAGYNSLKTAQAACKRHFKKFGPNPSQNDKTYID